MKIIVESNIRDYEVQIEPDLNFFHELSNIENSFYVIDRNVAQCHPSLLNNISPESLFLFDATEENKTIEYAFQIYDFLVKANAKKNIKLVSVGGGITQDVTGFIASTLYRGISWTFVPTTFLAMTDSCIGSKTSINYKAHKNLLGTFYPPHEIFIWTQFIQTLTDLDFYSGVGESVKLQLMKESYPKDFDDIALTINRLTARKTAIDDTLIDNLNVKISYIANDEFDQGRRNLLNYGHCLGHALETTSGYYIPHGIAVTIGMIYANFLSEQRGLMDAETVAKINDTLLAPNIPLELKLEHFDVDKVLNSMRKDKKRTGKHLSAVIPNQNFELILSNDVLDEEVSRALNSTVEYLF